MTDKKINKVINILVRNDGSLTLWNHELKGTSFSRNLKTFTDLNASSLAMVLGIVSIVHTRQTARKLHISSKLMESGELLNDLCVNLRNVYGTDKHKVGYNVQVNLKKTASTRAHEVLVL